jgi:hypothetical protein
MNIYILHIRAYIFLYLFYDILSYILSRILTKLVLIYSVIRRPTNTVGYASTNDATTNECYNEQFLSIKSGCYNERGGILSADVARACA